MKYRAMYNDAIESWQVVDGDGVVCEIVIDRFNDGYSAKEYAKKMNDGLVVLVPPEKEE